MAILKFLKKSKLLLIILLVASVLRLWNLGNIPPHLRNDEAALGYSAYSILNTGKDEYGEFLPIIFQSFGDWKMGLYVYLTVPFVAILGLSEVAVRLPSALAGIAAVFFMYGVSLELFQKKRIAYIASFLLAISPVMVAFSRGAWEVNVSFALTLAGIYFLLVSLSLHPKFLFLSSIFFGMSFLTSHGAKFLTPVIIIMLVLLFHKKFKKLSLVTILSSFLIILLFAFPVILSFSQGKVSRLTTLSIFSYESHNGYNETVSLIRSILSRWLSLYSFSTLFIKGDSNPQHGAPNVGPFLLIDSILLLFGFIRLAKIGSTKPALFIWLSIFLLALPSALTIEKANFDRALGMFIPLLIIEAFGFDYLWENVKRYGFASRLLFLLGVLYLVNYIYFLDQYFIHEPKKNDAWQYGYKQIVQKIIPVESRYRQIVVQQSLEQPYIFFLFYQKYNPEKYQKFVKEVFVPNKEGKDMGLVSAIDNIEFSNIDWSIDKPASGILYVMPVYKLDQQSHYYSSYRPIDEIKDLNGSPLFKIIETI